MNMQDDEKLVVARLEEDMLDVAEENICKTELERIPHPSHIM